MRRRPSLWLFDCVTASNFALTGRLDLLVRRYGLSCAVTSQVLDEMSSGVIAGHLTLRDLFEMVDRDVFKRVTLTGEEEDVYRDLLTHLCRGEASTIAVARHREGIVVTDDKAARATCRDFKLPVTGTIGILVAEVREGLLSQQDADTLLVRMIDAGFRSPVSRLSDLL